MKSLLTFRNLAGPVHLQIPRWAPDADRRASCSRTRAPSAFPATTGCRTSPRTTTRHSTRTGKGNCINFETKPRERERRPTYRLLHTVPDGGHRGRHQGATITDIIMTLDPETQFVGQSPTQAAAEEKGDGAHQELAHEQHHNQHEVLTMHREKKVGFFFKYMAIKFAEK